MEPTQRRTNGQQKGSPRQRPQDSLDLQQEVIESTSIDPLLDQENLGTGNYRSNEMWQQVESYRNGLYATAAFRNTIEQRSKQETKNRLAIDGWEWSDGDGGVYRWEGWEQLSPDERREKWRKELANQDGERFDRRRWIRRRGEQVLNELYELRSPEKGFYPALEALGELSGWSNNWNPAHNRMLMTRHEVSRSRGAQLLDNVFGRVKEQVQDVKGGGGLRK